MVVTSFSVCKLRCEYKENPIGIDVLRPRFSWQIQSDARDVMQTAYQIQVSENDPDFQQVIWDTGQVRSDQSVHVEYEGPPLKSCTRYYYRVRAWNQEGEMSEWSEIALFEMGLLRADEWRAKWITPEFETDQTQVCPLLRTTFTIEGQVKTARVYVTSLGLYELQLNGERVGDWVLTPGWTSYNNRLQYQTYDVTHHLRGGANAIGVILGNGWYKGELGWEGARNVYGNQRAVLLQMHIQYADGRNQTVVSDETWTSQTGPILMSEIYHGEIYDARLERSGWSTAEYDDSDWYGVTVLPRGKDMLVAQENMPTRIVEEIRPVRLIHTPAGEKVLDMGQNMVGWIRFKVKAPAGTEIVLRHAEVLDRDGNFYTGNLRKAKQTIRYVCKGEGEEWYQPHFTYQGFRYVQIEGVPGDVKLDDFIGCVIHSDLEQTGRFECSNALVNQLQHNILWGQKGNFVDIPTDCPQRNERLGWTGDAQIFIRTAAFNMNVAPFFTKWLRDLKADQWPSGGVPSVIPNIFPEDSEVLSSSSAWADAAVICPWTVYLCYGDKRLLEEQYDSMKAWVEYMRSQGDNEYLYNTGSHYGDWLGLDAKENSYKGATDEDYIATAFYAYSTRLLARAARVLGKHDDVEEYETLYKNIVEHFRREFVTPNGRLSVPTQTAHVLALWFDLVDESHRGRIARTLAKYIEDNNCHLSTGFVGTPYLCHALSQNGYNALAYKLLLQTDYPSWLYQVTKGATTMWEHWDSIKVDGSFWSDDMNSFNHYAYGAVGEWLYRVVAGIDTDEEHPGYKHILIRPKPEPALKYVKASLQTMYGEVAAHWGFVDGQHMEVFVRIPANTTATVVLPHATLSAVREGDRPLEKVNGIHCFKQVNEGVCMELGSGVYQFNYPLQDQVAN
ncbi:family 78 glycoside hydrolase catalytic domain [Polycladomyces sp. WAk]|uniref:alpha-L-rhamnosidase n=1 Tax=Polycladomyces zharkentensis TaxID=2807616 RepID=A0ABS2WJK5_9BACL|nr:family 78 glycoside hydrolase catalytic domain [Polycladomyces sp. WAk]